MGTFEEMITGDSPETIEKRVVARRLLEHDLSFGDIADVLDVDRGDVIDLAKDENGADDGGLV